MEHHQGLTGRELYEIWRAHAIQQRMTEPPAWDDADAATRATWDAFAAQIMPSD
ncbi:hypothetical protein CBM2626_A40038 [Cupriavidus taiwanensis]|uniref:hypothetical protein n=1 Tax=Cupriavidus taiwanensis TaxID=164546 RepID=UPI000E139551|nr:hypothetical protein [Cupriavidus taiwanensis]SOZ99493.1 hypothetical protein CBM2626_A40038 [Cupriavidus taiwanensis]